MRKIIIFSSFWLILSLIQSYFTEIIDDEAYYWVYSQFLDRGFFDHPPMIALLIKIGTAIFPGELGVRLLPSLLGAGTVFLILIMLKDEVRDIRLPMLVICAIPLLHLHVGGFLAIPDLPLVFFASLFFFFYKKYLAHESPLVILLLSLSIVLMLYSKYHAFLVIGLSILSNLKILYRRSFWLVVLVSTLLYLPHILWQVKHDFVSFGYHLIDRNSPFQFRHLLEYIGNQWIMVGPFCGFILLYLGMTKRTSDKFELALKFNLIGFFLVFLFSSLKGHVEPHWTAAAFVPMILLSVPVIEENLRLKKWVSVLSYISIPFILLVRLALIVDFDLVPDKVSQRFHNKEEFYMQIQEEARGRPVVFTNSFQKPSLYWFFTKEPAFTHNNYRYRKNQYDLWSMEADLQGQEVLYLPDRTFPGGDILQTVRGPVRFHNTEYFCHFNRVDINLPEIHWEFESGEQVEIDLELGNPTESSINFSDSCTHKPWLVYTIFSEGERDKTSLAQYSDHLPVLTPGEYIEFPVEFTVPEVAGDYQIMFSFGGPYMTAGIHGRPVTLTVLSTSTGNSMNN
ncbi:MAG: hypothetical protein E4H10_08165 [Bacteroidia bacterium]|nr:MAG: hypothetical protein E4H10_08165 [Bacteroidia bacterium]